jgi:class 3 adenylate cyclase/predicted ATPase
MTAFYEILQQVVELLQREGRVSYRALKRHFDLDDACLEDLKFEIVRVKQLAVDRDGEMLVWIGAPPAASSGVAPAPPEAPPAPEGERRQLTVMFCDLVDSTTLSGRLDPEDLRDVLRAYQSTCARVIEHFDGFIAQYLGDGLLVYFGYPLAHEDDARRAVLAGLGIVKGLGPLNERLVREGGVWLSTRVGIHTGPVVVGELGGSGDLALALGATPNVAARIEGLATPDCVVVSSATHRLVQASLSSEDLGLHHVKGVDAPMRLYRMSAPAIEDPVAGAEPAMESVPLVGRDDELRLLLGRWSQVVGGEGQVIMLCGEPGIGKSRLTVALRDAIRQRGHCSITHRCSPYYRNTALYPVIEQLRHRLTLRGEDSPETQLDKLERMFEGQGRPLEDVVPLLAALLSIPLTEGRYPPLNLSPQGQRQRTQEALMHWLLDESVSRPLLVVFEDLHWADPSTQDLLTLLFDQVATRRIMVLLTFRPQFTPSWVSRSQFTQLTLGGLGRRQVAAVIETVTGGRRLPDEVADEIIAKTDGVPLFVEELTKMVLESGMLQERSGRYELRERLMPLDIPVTLQDSLMARLDRLDGAKEVAQLGATLGREFSYALIRAVSPLAEEALLQGLRRLVDSELIHQKDLPPQGSYAFKHVLIQNAAYQSLLRRKRQGYHRSTARVLREQFPEVAEANPELLAYHCTEAGLTEQAVFHWGQAGQKAMRRSACQEAASHLANGLELLKGLPETPQRDQVELRLRTALGPALIAMKGYGAGEVERSYARARELCREMGETSELAPVLVGLEAFYLLRAELGTARDLAGQLLLLAERRNDPDIRTMAHSGMGVALFYLGEFAPTLAHLEQGIKLHDPRRQRTLAFQDPGVACLSWSAVALWILGHPDQALERGREAVELARELVHPFSLAFSLTWAARIHQARREPEAVARLAEETVALSTDQGFPFFAAQGTLMRGWALAQQGRAEDGVAEMQRGIKAWQVTGAELGATYFSALLAEVYGQVGKPKKGLAELSLAHERAKRTGERWWEAELYRQEGELLLSQGAARARAERCLQQALAIARGSRARSLELRAAMSLARLRCDGATTACNDEDLRGIHDGFDEGLDTRDLLDAGALLGEMALGTGSARGGGRPVSGV